VLDPDTASVLAKVATATLSQQLRKRGITGSFVTGVRPLRDDVRMVGIARTLRYVAHREDVFARVGAGFNVQKRTMDSIRPGEVLLIEARGELGAGTIGDILAARIAELGGAGVVTDGATRDTAALRAMELPVFAGGSHAAVLGEKHIAMDADLPITCGGALVMPGDVVVGDAEGVLVIPADLAPSVAADALEQERQERYIAEQVRQGASVEGLYPLGPAWRERYDQWVAADERATVDTTKAGQR
jgi:5-oxopent-3-ene-1,2,5-tricarboxylate decarboxylase / 2-hydroxyhepta-2,4-diene-1,7-dioate isomerase